VIMGGSLYGTAVIGGSGSCNLDQYTGYATGGCGTIYQLTDDREQVSYSFANGADGSQPFAVTAYNGALYGYALTSSGNQEIFAFTPAIGSAPTASATP